MQGGGASLYVHEIFKRLAWKYDVTIVSTAGAKLPVRERVDGINMVRIPFSRLCRLTIPIAWLSRITSRADIVIDNADVAAPWLTPIYVRKPSIAIIYQIVGTIFQYELKRPLSDIAQKAEPWIYKVYGTKKIVACSPSTKDDLMRFGIPSQNISTIRPGIDESFLSYQTRGKKFSNPTVVCISRFKRYKGLQFAIRAMSHVLSKIPTANLIIAGNGDDSEIRREISKAEIGSSVSLMRRSPHLWNLEKKSLLESAHIMLVPSVREGYGIVVIEANACGTPAIGWKVPGLQDSIVDGETGILVPFDNVELLGEQISNLLQDNDRLERMADSAKKWSRTHSWDKAAKEFEQVIDSALSIKG